MTTVNWNALRQEAAKAQPFASLEIGTYNLVVVKSTPRKSKDGTKDQINLLLKAEDGQVGAGATGFKLMTLTTDNADALNIWFRELACLGLDDAFFDAHPEVTVPQIAAILPDHRCVGIVKADKPYEGQAKTKMDLRAALDGRQPPLPAVLPVIGAESGPGNPGVPGMPAAAGLGIFAPAPGADPWQLPGMATGATAQPAPPTPF